MTAHFHVPVALLLVLLAAAMTRMERPWKPAPILTAEILQAAGVGGPVFCKPAAGDKEDGIPRAAALYLDLMRRTLINLPYFESTIQMATFNAQHVYTPGNSTSLQPRLEGLDYSTNTLTSESRYIFFRVAHFHVLLAFPITLIL